jgi:hypothetical protein
VSVPTGTTRVGVRAVAGVRTAGLRRHPSQGATVRRLSGGGKASSGLSRGWELAAAGDRPVVLQKVAESPARSACGGVLGLEEAPADGCSLFGGSAGVLAGGGVASVRAASFVRVFLQF